MWWKPGGDTGHTNVSANGTRNPDPGDGSLLFDWDRQPSYFGWWLCGCEVTRKVVLLEVC